MADFEVRVPGNDVQVTDEYDARHGEAGNGDGGHEAREPVSSATPVAVSGR